MASFLEIYPFGLNIVYSVISKACYDIWKELLVWMVYSSLQLALKMEITHDLN